MRTAEVYERRTFRRSADDPDRFELHRMRYFAPGRRVECVIPRGLRDFARTVHPDTVSARQTRNEIHVWLGWLGMRASSKRLSQKLLRTMHEVIAHERDDPSPAIPHVASRLTDIQSCDGESSGKWVRLFTPFLPPEFYFGGIPRAEGKKR